MKAKFLTILADSTFPASAKNFSRSFSSVSGGNPRTNMTGSIDCVCIPNINEYKSFRKVLMTINRAVFIYMRIYLI